MTHKDTVAWQNSQGRIKLERSSTLRGLLHTSSDSNNNQTFTLLFMCEYVDLLALLIILRTFEKKVTQEKK